jgi:hypothetical protein
VSVAEGERDPWVVLAQTDLALVRWPIPELGRYYDSLRAIVLRTDLDPDVERVVLWHELLHAERRDTACSLTDEEHEELDREAHRRALAGRG